MNHFLIAVVGLVLCTADLGRATQDDNIAWFKIRISVENFDGRLSTGELCDAAEASDSLETTTCDIALRASLSKWVPPEDAGDVGQDVEFRVVDKEVAENVPQNFERFSWLKPITFNHLKQTNTDVLGCFNITVWMDHIDAQGAGHTIVSTSLDVCALEASEWLNGNKLVADDLWHDVKRQIGSVTLTVGLRFFCGEAWGGDLCTILCVEEDPPVHYICRDGFRICQYGYEGDDCLQDVDACVSSPCPTNGVCDDLKCPGDVLCPYGDNPAGRTCSCAAGFHMVNGICVDSNACATVPCNANAVCTDLPAPAPNNATGRSCKCKPGFVGNGDVCLDVNECQAEVHNCHDMAMCLNVNGGFECRCKTGFIGDGSISCLHICGDGFVVFGEACDDGNTNDGDGCSQFCRPEQGWTCGGAGVGSCEPVCGDGMLRGGETCDDGNVVAGDGCSASCQTEPGFHCDPSGGEQSCLGICGDGLRVIGEECDPGQAESLACTSTCIVQPGFACPGEHLDSCFVVCGDGLKAGTETCDDGNSQANDGCGRNCQTEPGYECIGVGPGSCRPVCGDLVLVADEACDDGNKNAGDGCSPDCTVETGFVCDGIVAPYCRDINECASDQACGENAVCLNTPGSFECPCARGFVADGGKCVADCDAFASGRFARNNYLLEASCTGKETMHGANVSCSLECADGYRTLRPGVPFQCSAGGNWVGLAAVCLEILPNAASVIHWTAGSPVVYQVPKVGGSVAGVLHFENLPTGIVFRSATSTLSGKADKVGEYRAVCFATLHNGTAFEVLSLNIFVYPPLSSTGLVQYAVQRRPFHLPALAVSGGRAPRVFSVVRGALPPGLAVNPLSGHVQGTPTTLGEFRDIVVAVSDSNSAELVFEPFTLVVGKPLNISVDKKFASVQVAVPANQPFALPPPDFETFHSNGDVTFVAFSGVPPGLTVDPATAAVGGSPTTVGKYKFDVFAKDEADEIWLMESVTLEVLEPTDCESDENGPNNRGCGAGMCVDNIPRDNAFVCDCSASGFQGENCDLEIKTKTRVKAAVSSVVVVPVVCAAVLVMIGLAVWWRRRTNALQLKLQPFEFPAPDEWEHDRSKVTMTTMIGEGEFGTVYSGVALDVRQQIGTTRVAVKQCKANADADHKHSFVTEAVLMKRLHHPNVVRLLGVCTQEDPLLIILELMPNGDLKSYLRKHLGIDLGHLLGFCRDVARAVSYLASQNIVHRDLAARNCLVDDQLHAKLADFGMGRDTAYKDYYRLQGEALLPVRWMAPEALKTGQFSQQTDVWALGVVLWETLSRGEVPFAGMGNVEVYHHVEAGNVLEQPLACPTNVYEIMKRCWEPEKARWTAAQVLEGLVGSETPQPTDCSKPVAFASVSVQETKLATSSVPGNEYLQLDPSMHDGFQELSFPPMDADDDVLLPADGHMTAGNPFFQADFLSDSEA